MTEYISTAKVRLDRIDHSLIITINRPEARNAIDGEVSQAVGEAIRAADADPDVRVIILTGAGDQSFSAGADLKALSRGEQVLAAGAGAEWSLGGFVNNVTSKPTIAAVNGTALGGGLELALACDIIVAEEQAVFGLPEVKRGLIAGAGGAFRLVEQMPPKIANELLLTGRTFGADEAQRWGLVNRVVTAGHAVSEALRIAHQIASNAPLAVQGSKRLAQRIVDGVRNGEVDAWRLNAAESAAIMATEDAAEGPRAFAEKRAPVWNAR
jgi:crotonobetainyl-CoA hydratase